MTLKLKGIFQIYKRKTSFQLLLFSFIIKLTPFSILEAAINNNENSTSSQTESAVKPGFYQHYKGKNYQVFDTAQHSETGEKLVVYRPLYGDRALTVRPASMFEEPVMVEGKVVPRFALIKNPSDEMISSMNESSPPKGEIKPGFYQHYKGKNYQVFDTAQHSETGEKLVVYRPLYGDHALTVRPASMFEEPVMVEGRKVPRFRLIERDLPHTQTEHKLSELRV